MLFNIYVAYITCFNKIVIRSFFKPWKGWIHLSFLTFNLKIKCILCFYYVHNDLVVCKLLKFYIHLKFNINQMFIRQNTEGRIGNGNYDIIRTELHFKGLEACQSTSEKAQVSHTYSFCLKQSQEKIKSLTRIMWWGKLSKGEKLVTNNKNWMKTVSMWGCGCVCICVYIFVCACTYMMCVS